MGIVIRMRASALKRNIRRRSKTKIEIGLNRSIVCKIAVLTVSVRTAFLLAVANEQSRWYNLLTEAITMYKYETHLHTSPVSRCARVSVEENLEFYKRAGYDGVFITNHFLDGNLNCEKNLPYEERIEFYFSDYEEGLGIGKELGIKVFLGVEISYAGTDFLIYGLDKEWYLNHPEIMKMRKSVELAYMMENGAFIIQAHPFRDKMREVPPECIDGIETFNMQPNQCCRKNHQ